MKKSLRFLCSLLAAAFIALPLSGCHGAVCIGELEITDTDGGGVRTCYVYSPAVNDRYIDQGKAQAEWLSDYLIKAVGEKDASCYEIRYMGNVSAAEAGIADSLYEMTEEERSRGYDVFSLSYSFDSIKDYNAKTRRLYNLSAELVMQTGDDTYRIGVLDDYVDSVLRISDIYDVSGDPTGKCSVTFTETGAVSYGVAAWAFIALYRNRADESMWKTDEIYFAPFSPDETHTVFSALKTQLTVTVGDTSRTVTPITGPVVEGQGEVEGILFNVTGQLYRGTEEPFPVVAVTVAVCACLLVAGAVIIIVLSRKIKKEDPGRPSDVCLD